MLKIFRLHISRQDQILQELSCLLGKILKKSNILRFLLSFLDIIVCWNYHTAKQRLNERKSVSFYSRSYFQEEVVSGEFLRKELKNGDTPVLFKRKDIITFFRSIDSFFGKPTGSEDEKDIIVDGKINNITDKTLLQKLKPLLNTDTPHTLEAIKVTQQFYVDLPQMKFRDWANLVKNVQFNVLNEDMKCDHK